MVGNRAVMADMIAAPQNDVVADGDKRLNGVVFEDKTVVADGRAGKISRPRADITDEPVAFLLEAFVDALPHPIHSLMESGNGKFAGRKVTLQFFKGDDR